jgi:hypothetical protein
LLNGGDFAEKNANVFFVSWLAYSKANKDKQKLYHQSGIKDWNKASALEEKYYRGSQSIEEVVARANNAGKDLAAIQREMLGLVTAAFLSFLLNVKTGSGHYTEETVKNEFDDFVEKIIAIHDSMKELLDFNEPSLTARGTGAGAGAGAQAAETTLPERLSPEAMKLGLTEEDVRTAEAMGLSLKQFAREKRRALERKEASKRKVLKGKRAAARARQKSVRQKDDVKAAEQKRKLNEIYARSAGPVVPDLTETAVEIVETSPVANQGAGVGAAAISDEIEMDLFSAELEGLVHLFDGAVEEKLGSIELEFADFDGDDLWAQEVLSTEVSGSAPTAAKSADELLAGEMDLSFDLEMFAPPPAPTVKPEPCLSQSNQEMLDEFNDVIILNDKRLILPWLRELDYLKEGSLSKLQAFIAHWLLKLESTDYVLFRDVLYGICQRLGDASQLFCSELSAKGNSLLCMFAMHGELVKCIPDCSKYIKNPTAFREAMFRPFGKRWLSRPILMIAVCHPNLLPRFTREVNNFAQLFVANKAFAWPVLFGAVTNRNLEAGPLLKLLRFLKKNLTAKEFREMVLQTACGVGFARVLFFKRNDRAKKRQVIVSAFAWFARNDQDLCNELFNQVAVAAIKKPEAGHLNVMMDAALNGLFQYFMNHPFLSMQAKFQQLCRQREGSGLTAAMMQARMMLKNADTYPNLPSAVLAMFDDLLKVARSQENGVYSLFKITDIYQHGILSFIAMVKNSWLTINVLERLRLELTDLQFTEVFQQLRETYFFFQVSMAIKFESPQALRALMNPSRAAYEAMHYQAGEFVKLFTHAGDITPPPLFESFNQSDRGNTWHFDIILEELNKKTDEVILGIVRAQYRGRRESCAKTLLHRMAFLGNVDRLEQLLNLKGGCLAGEMLASPDEEGHYPIISALDSRRPNAVQVQCLLVDKAAAVSEEALVRMLNAEGDFAKKALFTAAKKEQLSFLQYVFTKVTSDEGRLALLLRKAKALGARHSNNLVNRCFASSDEIRAWLTDVLQHSSDEFVTQVFEGFLTVDDSIQNRQLRDFLGRRLFKEQPLKGKDLFTWLRKMHAHSQVRCMVMIAYHHNRHPSVDFFGVRAADLSELCDKISRLCDRQQLTPSQQEQIELMLAHLRGQFRAQHSTSRKRGNHATSERVVTGSRGRWGPKISDSAVALWKADPRAREEMARKRRCGTGSARAAAAARR